MKASSRSLGALVEGAGGYDEAVGEEDRIEGASPEGLGPVGIAIGEASGAAVAILES